MICPIKNSDAWKFHEANNTNDYLTWNLNNGNPLNLDTAGKPSKQFESILDMIEKDRSVFDENISKIDKGLIKKGVKELFDSNPELSKIGSVQQYSNYLDTVFPNSKVKDIVYHNSPNKFDKFDNLKIGTTTSGIGSEDRFLGIFFTSDKTAYEGFNIKGYQYPSLVNLNNPKNGGINYNNLPELRTEDDFKNYQKQLKSESFDGINYGKAFLDMEEGGYEIPIQEAIVFEPEQIHILGSKQDIAGFKDFVNKNTSTKNNFKDFTTFELSEEEKSLEEELRKNCSL